jgi:protein TonB
MPKPGPADSKRSRSAEYAVAIPLLVVCVVVGLAFWLLKPGGAANHPKAQQTAAANATAGAAPSEESAAVADWKRRLQGDYSQAEQERRLKEQQDAELAAEKRKAQADALPPRPAVAPPPPVAAAAVPAAPVTAVAAPAPRQAPPAPAPAEAVPASPKANIVAATVDWTSCSRPKYPLQSIEAHEEGTVEIAADVDPTGRLLSSRLGTSSGFSALDQVSAAAVSKCHFKPGTRDGTPEVSHTTIRFSWKLSGSQ